MSFDWNKLNSYKEAIDDGLLLTKIENHKIIEISLFKGDYTLHIKNLGSFGVMKNYEMVVGKSWDEFKKKVADYFLGGVE